MYEPARTRPLPTPAKRMNAGAVAGRPPRTEHLNEPLAGHLAALLAVTEQLRAGCATPDPDLDEAVGQLSERIAQLSPGGVPARVWEGSHPRPDEAAPGEDGRKALHRRAHTLAGRVLVVAASRQDTATAMLACRRMDAHQHALGASAAPAA